MELSVTKTATVHNKNNRVVIGLGVLLGIFPLCILGIKLSSLGKIQGATTDLSPPNIISVVNATRVSHGITPLHPQPQLMKAAEAKAMAMLAANTWSHNTPTQTPWQFIEGEGYSYSMAGENLAKGYDSAEAVVNAWYNSPSHQANLMNKEFTDTGVAVVEGTFLNEPHTILVVEFLAKVSDPQNITNSNPEINQPPLLINPDDIKNTLYILVGIFSLSTLLIIIKLVRSLVAIRVNKKRPPNHHYWHQ